MMSRKEVRQKLWQSFVKSTFNAKVIVAFVLCLFVLLSAFSVVVVKYHYKVALDQEQKLYYGREDLRDQWTQILIEHSTLASPTHVEEVAKKNNMYLPKAKDIQTIQVEND